MDEGSEDAGERRGNPVWYGGGCLWDRTNRRWQRADDWIEPDEAVARIAGGASWAVEWCGGGGPARFVWSDELPASALADDVQPRLVTRARARRLRRRRSVPTVLVAEGWYDDAGEQLVLFHESGPAPRPASWFG